MEKEQLSSLTDDMSTMAVSGTKKLLNLTSTSNQSAILFATDEWFATAENLLNPSPPTFVPDLFCEQGKVMDGWETRRRRTAGHDWCVIKLCSGLDDGSSGRVRDGRFSISMIELDTGYFTGNQTPRVSIEAMKVTRSSTNNDGDDMAEHDSEDYLYEWMPGASTRLARGGRGIRGTGQSPATIQRALEACQSVARKTIPNNPSGEWITVLPMTPLQPGYEESRYHTFEIANEVKKQIESLGGVTHLKLNYFPDGGVARLRVHGYPSQHYLEKQNEVTIASTESNERSNAPKIHPHNYSNPALLPSIQSHSYPELSSELVGGLGLACSNKHYGVPSNLLRPYPGKDMGDGWETARHPDRPPIIRKDPVTGLQDTSLMDWSVLKLGCGGTMVDSNGGVTRIIVDTRHFKGNYPESVAIDACYAAADGVVSDEEVCTSAGEYDTLDGDKQQQQQNNKSLKTSGIEWFPLLKRTLLTAHAEHEFQRSNLVNATRGVTHVRVSITPDGGLSRVRIYGSPAGESVENLPRSHL